MNAQLPPSLAYQNRARMDELVQAGFPRIAEMCQHFTKAADMDRALGYMNATAGWVRGKGHPSQHAENAAAMWLQLRTPPREITPESATTGALVLVACPTAELAAKVARMAALIGCEATEV